MAQLPPGGPPSAEGTQQSQAATGCNAALALPPATAAPFTTRATWHPTGKQWRQAVTLPRRVANDVEAGPRVAGIPRSRRFVLDGHLTVRACHDNPRW